MIQQGMTPEAEYLLSLAQRIADGYASDPRVAAILLAGSAAHGDSDSVSDLDIAIFYTQAILPDELAAIRESAEASGGLFYGGEPDGFVVSRYEDGIKCDLAHSTIPRWQENVAGVLEKHDPASPYQKVLSGLHDGRVLSGAPLIESLRAESPYPEPLRAAMVRANLTFWPTELIERMMAERGDTVWLYESLARAATQVLAILCGLNRLYHWGEFKRQATLCRRFALAPENLAVRLDRALTGPDWRELHAVIDETLTLAEAELPALAPEVEAARKRLHRPLPRWSPKA